MKKTDFRIVLSVLLLLIYVLFSFVDTNSLSNSLSGTSTIEVNDYKADIIIDSDGDMQVTELWDMTYNDRYRVRFRDIEYNKFPDDYPLPHSNSNKAIFNTTDYNATMYKGGVVYNDATYGYSFNGDYDERGDRVACPKEADDKCESFFIDSGSNMFNPRLGHLNGDVKFEYEYTIENVITEYSDVSELNWVLFEYAEGDVESGIINIVLPDNANDEEDYLMYIPQIENGEVTYNSNKSITIRFENMSKKDVLAFRLLVPTSTFSSIESQNKFIDDDMNKQVIMNFEQKLATQNAIRGYMYYVALGIALFSNLYLVFAAVSFNNKYGMPYDTSHLDKNIQTPPSDHAPAIMGYLYRDLKYDEVDLSATLLDLIHRGYLEIDDSRMFDNPDYTFDELIEGEANHVHIRNFPSDKFEPDRLGYSNKTYKELEDNIDYDIILNKEKDIEELYDFEQLVIKLYIDVLGDGEKVSIKDIELGMKKKTTASSYLLEVSRFKRLIRDFCQAEDHWDKVIIKEKKKAINKSTFMIIPGILMIILSIFTNEFHSIPFILLFAGVVVYAFYINAKKRRSQQAEEFHMKWHYYKENLENMNIIKNAKISDLEFWDFALVYATVFDIPEKVLDKIQTEFEEIKETDYKGYRYRYRNYFYYRYMHRRIRTQHQAYRTKASYTTMPKSTYRGGRSGGSFGGGFGGGGSFGGGGGGGRSR